ncbi:BAG family molecular chaperone regulator 1-like [Fagus crenata]
MKSKMNSMFSNTVGDGGNRNVEDLEIRPGGMLVQKREMNQGSTVSIPTIKVRVKYGSLYHEIHISSQASFGDLKKMLAEPTGLHHLDQKLIFKKKERDSKAYLDAARVKDGSKIELVEDIVSRERRCLEMLKNAKVEKASKSLSEISLEVDKIAGQVTALEATVSRGGKITVMDVESLTEMLMANLVKLDEIVVDGDLKLQRRVEVKRVQKHIESLDKLKLHCSMPGGSGGNSTKIPQQQRAHSSRQMSMPMQKHQVQLKKMESKGQKQGLQQQPLQHSESFVVTTQWETFE